MTVTNIPSPEDNPFFLIKVRHIFGWYFLLGIGIYFQIAIINHTPGIQFDTEDPLVEAIFGTYLEIFILALVLRQCRLAGIQIKYLVGKVPNHYQWLPVVGLAIASEFFSIGVFRIFYYPLSFIVPSFVEQILTENRDSSILIEASQTFNPGLYYLMFALDSFVIFNLFFNFIFLAIIPHRWAAKWGNIPAIVALCLLWMILGYKNFIAILVYLLIYLILYLKTRSLRVIIVFGVVTSLIFTIWDLSHTIFFNTQTANILDTFRSQIQLGVLFFALSAPWVIGFIYKNWSVLKGPLPYFANASEADKIKADSET
ncbi:hypothetical protein NDA07_04275 [Microcoleus vaginatus DQ-U2]|uniref:hypothetical protein n=1 Tax=Microcoleus vaginatus TaxID=119532 RepID=UPI00168754AC|nr:hypothetical protein [Microcoleus sp. FACHB-DQ6]